ncbi:hypothetical protein X777_06880 [Ooceraea biroi]|uniref:Uncharacterized protein n=1 Tax=Ooceraea biroi TaxID=2015173 RepID=A0A026WDA4_OOCBI|nr:hypothetical protein X777_06880 [Ooceraea biroi]
MTQATLVVHPREIPCGCPRSSSDEVITRSSVSTALSRDQDPLRAAREPKSRQLGKEYMQERPNLEKFHMPDLDFRQIVMNWQK